MIKPLLRTIPSVSGNISLYCDLTDFFKTSKKNVIECYSRNARLVPLSNELSHKKIEIGLLDSTYEFDLRKFYFCYSNYFFKSLYSFSEINYGIYSLDNPIKDRDEDFEFGVRRVSPDLHNGNTFAFYAPFYAESENDIPDYFDIRIKLNNKTRSIEKHLKVFINNDNSSYRYNYLNVYIHKYFKSMDSNVIICHTKENKATYYGVSLINGGFCKVTDNIVGKNYAKQMGIGKFDENLILGFERNKICIRQIMPISFCFNLDDILSEEEKKTYKYATLTITGSWYKDDKELSLYDFSTDYSLFTQDYYGFDENEIFGYVKSKQNIMNFGHPSLFEASVEENKFFNVIKNNTFRWKLKYSDDIHPYVTNLSVAFSLNCGSLTKYGDFPSNTTPVNCFCDTENNLVLPEANSTNEDSLYAKHPKTVDMYKKSLLLNSSNWFTAKNNTEWYEKIRIKKSAQIYEHYGEWYKEGDESLIYIEKSEDLRYVDNDTISQVVPLNIPDKVYVKLTDEEYADILENIDSIGNNFYLYLKHTIFDDESLWSNVQDDKAYFKGILYDFSRIWRKYPKLQHLDKFGVFISPIFNYIHKDNLELVSTVKWTINTKESSVSPNAFISSDITEMLTGKPLEEVKSLFINEKGVSKQRNEVIHDAMFVKNISNDHDERYIDFNELGYDVNVLNRYWRLDDILRIYPELSEIIERTYSMKIIQGFELIQSQYFSQLLRTDSKIMLEKHKHGKAKWIFDNLYFSTKTNTYKVRYDKHTFKDITKNALNSYDVSLFMKIDFISNSDLRSIAGDVDLSQLSELDCYEFNPIYVKSNETVATNLFTKVSKYDNRYGAYIPYNLIKNDLDMLYVDIYNMMNTGVGFDDSWLLDENEDLYYIDAYCKFLNMQHLSAYLTETIRDENKSFTGDKSETLFIKKRVLYNDFENNKITVKDKYVSLRELFADLDDSTLCSKFLANVKYIDAEKCWMLEKSFVDSNEALKTALKNELYLNEDNMTYKFELVFKKKFVKMNNKIWENINLKNNKKYKDLYIYTMSKEDDYPKPLKYYYEDNETSSMGIFEPCGRTLKPFFDSVFLQDKEVTVIYKEYNQSKISKANIIDLPQNDEVTTFYRYNCDNTICMYDISEFDTVNAYMTSKGYDGSYTYWISYSYINNAKNSYAGDNVIIEKIQNDTLFDDDSFKILPTHRLVSNPASSIVNAKGTRQVLQYYSESSYDYLSTTYYTYSSYYSDYSYNRINFEHLSSLKIGYFTEAEHFIIDSHDGIDTYAYNQQYDYIVDDVYTYHNIKARYLEKPVFYDDLKIYDEYKLSTCSITYEYKVPVLDYSYSFTYFNEDEEAIQYENNFAYETKIGYYTYGMIWIDAEFDNTNKSFNIVDSNNVKKKYFTDVFGFNIYKNSFDITYFFKNLVPFSKLNIYNSLNSSKFIIKPEMFTFDNRYITTQNQDGSYHNIYTNKNIGKTTLERYFDNIVPFMPKKTEVTTYFLKLKSTNETIENNSYMTVYKDTVNINKYSAPRLYSEADEYNLLDEVERKYYNDNRYIYLEKEFTITVGDNLKYSEVIENETKEKTLEHFGTYIKAFGNFDEESILFLYNKYSISYDSEYVGIDYRKIAKIYSLKLIFKLK